jgi:hypothetical protein
MPAGEDPAKIISAAAEDLVSKSPELPEPGRLKAALEAVVLALHGNDFEKYDSFVSAHDATVSDRVKIYYQYLVDYGWAKPDPEFSASDNRGKLKFLWDHPELRHGQSAGISGQFSAGTSSDAPRPYQLIGTLYDFPGQAELSGLVNSGRAPIAWVQLNLLLATGPTPFRVLFAFDESIHDWRVLGWYVFPDDRDGGNIYL